MNRDIVYFIHTSRANYDSASTKLDNCLYLVKNDNQTYDFYKGDRPIKILADNVQQLLDMIRACQDEVNALTYGAPEALDTLKELGEAFKSNKNVIESINNTLKNGQVLTELDEGIKTNKTSIDEINKTLKNGQVLTEIKDKINTKEDKLVSGKNIRSINNLSIVGSGDLTIRVIDLPNYYIDIKNIVQNAISNGLISLPKPPMPQIPGETSTKTIIESLASTKRETFFPQPNQMLIPNAFNYNGQNSGVNVELVLNSRSVAIVYIRKETVTSEFKTYEISLLTSELNTERIKIKIKEDNGSAVIELTDRSGWTGYDLTKSKVYDVICNG